MRRAALSLALTLLSLCWMSCHDEAAVGVTQVTARIYIASEVREAMRQLRVRTFRNERGRFTARAERSYDSESLDAVVDIGFVPEDAKDEGTVLVVADALDADDNVLVQARGAFDFVLHEQRFFELWLYRCAGMELGTLCSEPDCADQSCQTCVSDRCAPTPLAAKPQLSTLDPAVTADPDKLPPGYHDTDAADGGSHIDSSTRVDGELLDAESPDGCASAEDPSCATDPDAGSSLPDATGDAGQDVEPFDAGAPDASARDAGDAAARDAAVDAGGDAQEPAGRCAQASAWTTREANGTIPLRARVLAQHTNASGTLPQYLCRALAPDGVTLVPGKVSGSATLATRLDNGCYGTYFASAMWQSFGANTPGASFQVLTPASECQLDWVAMNAGQALPTRALAVGNTGGATSAPLYACRIEVQDATTSGTHIGRVGNALGDTCHVQYYQQPPIERSQFEVLVQTRP